MNHNPVIVGIAQAGVVKIPEELITYALGSCVGVCLYDRKSNIAGMAHVMLPSGSVATDRSNPYKFADSGCELLLRTMLQMGADRHSIIAKLAGGATMFQIKGQTEGIGERNVVAVRNSLRQLGIRIVAEDTGKDYGRTVVLDSISGDVTVKSVKYGSIVI